MTHFALSLLLFAASPDCLSDALADCRLTPPATVAVAATGELDHYAAHDLNAAVRNQHGGWDKCGAAYLGDGKSAVVAQPPLRMSAVAAAVPERWRGTGYPLYMIQYARQWERQPLFLLDEQSAYCSGSFWYAKNQPSGFAHSADRAKEISRYCTVLLRLARALPGYDARQLQAILEYQWTRVGSLTSLAAPAAQPSGSPPVAKPVPANTPAVKTAVPNGPTATSTRHGAPGDDPWAGTIVLHYTAPWCSACRTLEPLYERLRRRPGVTILEVDVTKPLPAFVVRAPVALPTVLVFRNRKLLGHWSGAAIETQQAVESAATKGE